MVFKNTGKVQTTRWDDEVHHIRRFWWLWWYAALPRKSVLPTNTFKGCSCLQSLSWRTCLPKPPQSSCTRSFGQVLSPKALNKRGLPYFLEFSKAETCQSYARIVARVYQNPNLAERSTAQRLLGWISCSKRPLKWHEIQGAVSMNTEDQTVDFENRRLCMHILELSFRTWRSHEILTTHVSSFLFFCRAWCTQISLTSATDSILARYSCKGYLRIFDRCSSRRPSSACPRDC